MIMLCCCCGRIRRERLQHGYQQQAVQLAQLRLAQMQTGGAIRGPLAHGVLYSGNTSGHVNLNLRAILRRFQSAQSIAVIWVPLSPNHLITNHRQRVKLGTPNKHDCRTGRYEPHLADMANQPGPRDQVATGSWQGALCAAPYQDVTQKEFRQLLLPRLTSWRHRCCQRPCYTRSTRHFSAHATIGC